jgi:hypothetical protein
MKIKLLCLGVCIGILITGCKSKPDNGNMGAAYSPGGTVQGTAVSQNSISLKSEQGFSIIERGPHHRIWERTEYEMVSDDELIPHRHRYTELATGMHYREGDQWLESQEKIEILPNNAGAVAAKGQHKAIFPPEIKAGIIELQTPEGQWLRSRAWGLAYFDAATSESVLLAEVKESEGQLVGDNVVVYPDALTDFAADIRYTYTLAGFEQDVVLREQPPGPETFGLNPQTTRLQMLTEFVETPTPTKHSRTVGELTDEMLGFGTMSIGSGKAFSVDAEGEHTGDTTVSKQWERIDGRDFLIEQVPFEKVNEHLQKLPPAKKYEGARLHLRGHGESVLIGLKQLMPKRYAKTAPKSGTKCMAKISPKSFPGFVIDYVSLNSQSNYTFQGDTTYFITGLVSMSGITIIEGGAILKFYTSLCKLQLDSNPLSQIVCKTGPYQPAIFTSINDDTVGEKISGSTGFPAVGAGSSVIYLSIASSSYEPDLKYIRMSYACVGVDSSSTNNLVEHCQFVKCRSAFNYASGRLFMHNVLFSGCTTNIVTTSGTNFGEHLTIDSGTCDGYGIFTNSILTAVTNLSSLELDHCITNSVSTGFYQAVIAGNYYLVANSTNRDCGTTNISSKLLAELKQKTTYPPITTIGLITSNTTLWPQLNRDKDVPDLGYHYDPIDYMCGAVIVSNSILTLVGGTVVTIGIRLASAGLIVSVGTPVSPNWFIPGPLVQEQWSYGASGNGTAIQASINVLRNDTRPNASLYFSKMITGGGIGYHFNHTGNASFNSLLVQNCELLGGNTCFNGPAASGPGTHSAMASLINNLFWRCSIYTLNTNTNATLTLTNNLFWNTKVTLSNAVWSAVNNGFDGCELASSFGATNGYNAFLNCTGSLNPSNTSNLTVTTNLAYQLGPLGNFYQPSDSVLIDAGSVMAPTVGLYHFTTQTNQTKETTSIVDIGYHYVAVDSNGNPVDTDGDGIPDYLEDANGNGAVNTGETDWQSATDLGLKVIITRPRNNSLLP